ncbi:aminotransferase class I/II-fold pyridoxal phosphate-dependent enzyme [bacterium]|nr:aminotransferase class I/II-fold pyridoxal phosphate-dependent enzyme [candidate division CSSED10-310 bacterium]
MTFNKGFKKWDRPYLFHDLEVTLRSMPEKKRNNIVRLAIGDPDLPTPEGIKEALCRSVRSKYYGYPCTQGRIDLREAIVEYYQKRFKVMVHPDEIIIGPGAKTDLFDLGQVFSNPGNQAMILDPAYPVYCDTALYHGLNPIYLKGSESNNYQPPIPSDIDISSTDLIFSCYPNNPTGVTASRSYIKELLEFAISSKSMLIFDIAYADFIPGAGTSEAFSVFNLPGAEEVGIEVGSFSKPFSMTGYRISWTVIKNPIARQQWLRFRSNKDSGVSDHIQTAAFHALTDSFVAQDVVHNMKIYGERASLLVNGLRELGLMVRDLKNTPYAWFSSPISDSKLAAKIILEKALVQVTPGVGFGSAGEGFLRATIFQSDELIEEALSRLKTIHLSEYINAENTDAV